MRRYDFKPFRKAKSISNVWMGIQSDKLELFFDKYHLFIFILNSKGHYFKIQLFWYLLHILIFWIYVSDAMKSVQIIFDHCFKITGKRYCAIFCIELLKFIFSCLKKIMQEVISPLQIFLISLMHLLVLYIHHYLHQDLHLWNLLL